MSKEKNILIGIVTFIGILLLVGFLVWLIFFSGIIQSVFQFEYDFLPYGESTNQITNLVLTGISYWNDDTKISETRWDSKYWEITEHTAQSCYLCGAMGNKDGGFSGSDLSFNSGKPQYDRNSGMPVTTTLISKEDFSERDFKTNFIGHSGTPQRPGEMSLTINLIGTSSVNVINYPFPPGGGITEYNVVIHPRVVDNIVEIFANGQKIKEVTMDNYKIQISTRSQCGYSGHGTEFDCEIYTTMNKPSYKSQFGCTKEAGEQYYVSIFNEGNSVNLNKLDNFKKFCLSEFPIIIHTNTGATTETSILDNIINGEQFVVPNGQIWTIEYIGEMTTFGTTCEANEVYNNKEDICMARTVLSVTCPSGSTFNSEKGYCIVETKPIEFILSTIETHKDLENNNMFRFTQLKEDKKITSQSSFSIGDNTFSSGGLSYIGSLQNVNYPEDKNNWEVNFNFNEKSYKGIEDSFKLDEFISVEITRILGHFDDDTMSVEDYQIDYTFKIDTSFLETTYSNKIITVENTYQDFNGGITLTTTNNLGTTIVEDIEKQLPFGKTTFNIDTENILDIKVRPFIKISTPNYDYYFDSLTALTVETPNDNGGNGDGIETSLTKFLILVAIGILVIFIIFIIILVIRKR